MRMLGARDIKRIATSKWWIRSGKTARGSKRLENSGGGLSLFLISNTDDHMRESGFFTMVLKAEG